MKTLDELREEQGGLIPPISEKPTIKCKNCKIFTGRCPKCTRRKNARRKRLENILLEYSDEFLEYIALMIKEQRF